MLQGLAPIVGAAPTLLILGSMPSVASLQKQQYYGHPRNAFWPMLARLNNFCLSEDYALNVLQAKQHRIAVWDVIGECVRPGSLDSAIVKGSERINTIPAFLEAHSGIRRIGLNGGLAAKLFERHCLAQISAERYEIYNLPSTSPANAAINFAEKCRRWQPLFNVAPLIDAR